MASESSGAGATGSTASKPKKHLFVLGALALALGGLMVPIKAEPPPSSATKVPRMDLSSFSADKPAKPLRLLFIHHSSGGQLFADKGDEKERANCILETHPNGGGLRKRLTGLGYEVHEASYGSEVGDKTDLFDWRPKFSQKMDKVLTVDENDRFLPAGKKHDVVMFKSCYPNNRFVGRGEGEGNPAGPELTVANAKATLLALLDDFKKHPDTLYVYVTAPPNAPPGSERAFKVVLKKLTGKPTAADAARERGKLAREFNEWVVSKDGWLKDYPLKNVVAFDYYDVLTGNGRSDLTLYPTGDGTDEHPSSEGNTKAAEAFPELLNRAVRRAGLSD
ncbi:MAG TPA: SGNH/GDSL hydrolase family protein [Polyangiaceae bacterium]|jgi:hypothetical protein|nr:SGNH/GDSL hydrolase family protein [Polyangiaceae bacterium]